MNDEKNREMAKKNIDKLFDEMNSIESKFKDANETTKLEYRNMINDLRIKKEEMEEKYARYKEASDATAKELQSAFEESKEIFRNNLSQLKERFKDNDEK